MKKPSRKISAINVVPYLDVMLVLLVIFMITAPLFGEVRLPAVGGEAPRRAALEIVFKLDKAFPFRIEDPDDPDGGQSPLDRAALNERLRTACIIAPERPIIISADVKRFYGEVMELLNDIEDAGCAGETALKTEPRE